MLKYRWLQLQCDARGAHHLLFMVSNQSRLISLFIVNQCLSIIWIQFLNLVSTFSNIFFILGLAKWSEWRNSLLSFGHLVIGDVVPSLDWYQLWQIYDEILKVNYPWLLTVERNNMQHIICSILYAAYYMIIRWCQITHSGSFLNFDNN